MMTKHEYPAIGETLYESVLPNGLRVSVIPKPGYTRSFAMFATRYGGVDRRFQVNGEFLDTPAGVAHFLEHKMFDMPDGDNALARISANGAQPNAFTSSDMTAYYFESTSGFYENLELLLRFVSTPYFTPESVAKEQGIIAQEIRMGDDEPGIVIYEQLLRCLFTHHPLRESIIGTEQSIARITPEVLYHCHNVFYHPANMCLSVVGDVDPQRVEELALAVLPAGTAAPPIRDYGPPEDLSPAETRYHRSMEVSAPQFLAGRKLIAAEKGPALLRQKLLGGLALSYLFGQSSPFYLRLYQQGLLNTDFSTGMEHMADALVLLAGGESRDPEAVLAELLAELRRVSREGLDPALWSRIKKSAYGSRIRALSSFAGLCSSLTDGAFGQYNCLDSFAEVEAITDADVLEFIRTQLQPEHFAMSVLTPLNGKEREV